MNYLNELPPYLQQQAYQYRIEKAKALSHYHPLEWQKPVLADESFTLLLTGSAGGGKSRCGAELVHRYMLKYPGATGLLLRKAREYAMKSIVPFMRYRVMGKNPPVDFKKSDSMFMYHNGGMLFWGGMKDDNQREALRSIGQDGALDIVLIEEGNAFSEDDYNELIPRMRGKAGKYRQIVIMTNPDAPNHWINQRLIVGQEANVYYSGAKDNPYNPPEYVDYLNKLTGTLYQRLVLGRWVQAEGVVFDNFSQETNMSLSAEYQAGLEIFWGVDDGYAEGKGVGHESYHPRVILFGQVTGAGCLNIFAEFYKTGQASYQDTIRDARDYKYPEPMLAYIDSSAAMFKGALWEAGISTIGATHKVVEGIKNLRQLICDGTGVRRVMIHPRCKNLIRELLSYRYGDNTASSVGEQRPMKLDDHGVDALRYLAWRLRFE